MTGKSAQCEFTHHLISRLQRKSAMEGRTAAVWGHGECLVWAVLNQRQVVKFHVSYGAATL